MKQNIIFNMLLFGGLYVIVFGILFVSKVPHDFWNGITLIVFGILCASIGTVALSENKR